MRSTAHRQADYRDDLTQDLFYDTGLTFEVEVYHHRWSYLIAHNEQGRYILTDRSQLSLPDGESVVLDYQPIDGMPVNLWARQHMSLDNWPQRAECTNQIAKAINDNQRALGLSFKRPRPS